METVCWLGLPVGRID